MLLLTDSSYNYKTYSLPDENIITEVLNQPCFIGTEACDALRLALLFKVHQPGTHSTFTSVKKSGRYFIEMSSLEESSPRAHSTFTSGKKEWAVFYRDVVAGKRALLVHTARLRLGRKSGRYFIEMTSLEESSPRAHSTFTSGKKEWAVFYQDDVDGRELSSCTQHVYEWEERVGGCLT